MIRLCTCSGGSTSLDQSGKRAAKASCRTCGGKPLVDGKESVSGTMLSTVGLELTNFLNTELTWKTVSKGNRSATRRARRPAVRSLKGRSRELVDEDPKKVDDMAVSDSEKHGVTILGQRFSDKEEHVPYKKRRFLFQSPSPSPENPSLCDEESEWLNRPPASDRNKSCTKLIPKMQLMALDAAIAIEMGRIDDSEIVGGNNLNEVNEKLGNDEDFSGISILAAAACNNSMGGDVNDAENGSVVEDSALETSCKILANTESSYVAKELSRVHHFGFSGIINEGMDSCVSEMPVEGTSASLETVNSFPKDPAHGKNVENPDILCNSASEPQNLPNNQDDENVRRSESALRDDRSHWDLNIVMDSWEDPSDYPVLETERNTTDCPSQGDCETQGEPVDKKNDDVRKVCPEAGSVVSRDVDMNINIISDSRNFDLGTCKSNIGEQKSDAWPADGTICLQEDIIPLKTDSPPCSVVDPVDEVKQPFNQERIKSYETVVPASIECALESSSSDVPNANASTQCVTFTPIRNSESLPFYKAVGDDACFSHSPCSGPDHIISKLESEKNRNAALTGATKNQNEDLFASDAQTGQTICIRRDDAEKQDMDCSHQKISDKTTGESENVVKEHGDKTDEVLRSQDDGAAHVKTRSTDSCLPLEPGPIDDIVETAANKSEDVNISESLSKCESGASARNGQSEGALLTVQQDGESFLPDRTEVDPSNHVGSEEPTHKLSGETRGSFSSHEAGKSCDDDPANGSAKIDLEEDAFDYYSDVSGDDPGHIGQMEKVCEIQAGYDSQYEDGEFREPTVHNWEEYVDEEGEDEHVDYDSDNRDIDGFDSADHPVSMSVEIENGGHRRERSAYVHPSDIEDGISMNKKILETSIQPSSVGTLTADAMEAGSCEKRAVRDVKTTLTLHSAEKDGIGKSGMGEIADRETNTVMEKVARENQLFERGGPVRDSTQAASLMVRISGDMDARDGSAGKNNSGGRMDELDVGDMMSRAISSKAPKRELLSRIEAPESTDVVMKDRVFQQGSRSNSFQDSDYRNEREGRFVKSIARSGTSLHTHGRGRGSDRWIDSSECHWGPRDHHSPSCHGPGGFGQGDPENAAAAAAAKVKSSGFVVAPDGTIVKPSGRGCSARIQRSINASSHGVRRSLVRRGSPSDNDEAYGMHMGVGPIGEMSPDRSIVGRGRFGRGGLQVIGRGPRERYRGHMLDGSMKSSLQMPHPLNRRERSFSPTQRRGSNLSRSRTKSPSRSITRSPSAWPSPRVRGGAVVGCGPGLRHHSKSPNLRPESRTERMRSPYRQPGFAAEHVNGFVSMPRRRGSPQHSARWMDDRKDMDDHFREHSYRQRTSVSGRRSPGRIFHRSHRFDILHAPGRLKPDEYYRPMHPARFPEMIGGVRGSRFEGSDDDRRKHDERYGPIHPARRFGMNGSMKRFRYDVEDDFLAYNSYSKDAREYDGRGGPKDYDKVIDSRLGAVPRRDREEKSDYHYGRGRKYIAGSKSFGMREYEEEEDLGRRRRHS